MWFKNLRIYQIKESLNLSQEELGDKLGSKAYKPCNSTELSSYGWVSPLGKKSDVLVHEMLGCQMVCTNREEKILPSSVINDRLDELIDEFEITEGRKAGRKERSEIRDIVIQSLLPHAFSKHTKQYMMIDNHHGLILVDAASASKAEDMISLLRESIGSLPVVPLQVIIDPAHIMTEWLKNPSEQKDISIMDSCKLQDRAEGDSTVGCKGIDLTSDEVLTHVEAGKEVTQLAIEWDEHISCVIDSDLAIKRIRFLDLVQEAAADQQIETEMQAFDAHFSLMLFEFRQFLPQLFEIFGIEKQEVKAAA